MKHILRIFIISVMLAGFYSCELPDNLNPKSPTNVQAKTLFMNAQINMVDYLSSINQNLNNSRLLAQYAAQTTYTDESRYNFLDRQFNDALWNNLYHNVLRDLKEASVKLEDEKGAFSDAEYTNCLAAIDILEVYTYQVLVDQFGNIPYSEALQGQENPAPAYDDASTIYADLVARLTQSVNDLDVSAGSWGSYDQFFGGSGQGWFYFANSLKLRIAMRVADVNSSAQGWAEEAVTSGVFPSQAESVMLAYPGTDPNIYTIYEEMIQGGRKDFVPANTIVDLMNSLEDPRREYYFDLSGEHSGVYTGGPYGDGNVYGTTASYFDAQLNQPDFTYTLMDYVEVEFLLAEAVERGYSVGGTAEEHYNNAITESIKAWGGTDAEATAYLATTDVAYTTATGDWKQKIATQKYIALFERGVEAWAEWRRLDYPEFNPPPGMTYADIPVRQPYPFDEDNLNEDNYNAASSAIGGDEVSTRLFWDANASPFLGK